MKKIITFVIAAAIYSSLSAANYFVDLSKSSSGEGSSWETAFKTVAEAETAANANAGVDNIYVRGESFPIGYNWTLKAENYYFSCDADNTGITTNRTLNDNDGNGIVESWEFLNPTLCNNTNIGSGPQMASGTVLDGLYIKHVAARSNANMTTLICPDGATAQNCVIKDGALTYTNMASNNGGCLVKVLGTFKNSLIEKNTISITNNTSTDIRIAPILEANISSAANVNVSGCIIRNNYASINYSTGTSNITNLRGIALNFSCATAVSTVVFSNCLVYNNEFLFTGNATYPVADRAAVAGSVSSSGNTTNGKFINCTFANNKLTNMKSAMNVFSNASVYHFVYNNAFWNNQNTIISSSTTTKVGMSSSSTQNANTVVSNNVQDCPTSGTWGTALTYTNNLTNMSSSNTGTNAPVFKLPSTAIGNSTDGSVELADWRVLSTSYLVGKGSVNGTALILPVAGKDKSGYSFSPSTPAAGAYEASLEVPAGSLQTIVATSYFNSIIVNAGGQLTLSDGVSLNVGALTLNSDANNGTATFVDENENGDLTVSGTTNVYQFITKTGTGIGPTGRNWYISSPLTAATSSTITTATGNGLVYYDGTTSWPDAGTTMEVMKGYIAKSPAQNTTINFNGGTLNTGSQSKVNMPLGFNLVGNPYPSYVDFAQATRIGLENSIWYRSKKDGSYNFHTYNVTGGISVKDGTAIIAPMQSFWIKTTSATNTFTFTNAMRLHQDQSVVANRLKAPKANTKQLLRLRVSNSVNTDETVIYFNPEAQNTVDDYDSQKMFNNINDVPEIFTKNGTSNLVINGMNSIPFDTEIPLGFVTGETGNFSLAATEFNNFDAGTRIILKDKNTPNLEVELSNGLNYNFSSQATTSATDRFSLIFRAPGTTTGINANERMNAHVFVNAANQITIIAPEKASYSVYNAMGQLLSNSKIITKRTMVNTIRQAGVYVVKVDNKSTRVIIK